MNENQLYLFLEEVRDMFKILIEGQKSLKTEAKELKAVFKGLNGDVKE